MALKCGILGLPNVGKSTLFNAITKTSNAQAANYPFCTIEPNSGIVAVPDERLEKLSMIANSEKTIPNFIEIVDIAGLVRGAAKGEGLGNKFLSHIREVDIIIHLVRCFEDADITHVEGKINPVRDIEIINSELCIADLEVVERAMQKLSKRTSDITSKKETEVLQILFNGLNSGRFASAITNDTLNKQYSVDDLKFIKSLNLITAKTTIYACNIKEDEISIGGNNFTKEVQSYLSKNNPNAEYMVISAQIESELSQIESDVERKEFFNAVGIRQSGLDVLVTKCFKLLGLVCFFTIGPKEARAWFVREGSSAPNAAGVIHSDFEKGFIRAETIAYCDYIAHNGEQGCKQKGRLRLEGKDYIVQDGDVFHFRFNV